MTEHSLTKFNVPSVSRSGAFIYKADALDMYEHWPKPTCIIADGPYGLGKFPGEPNSVHALPEWYAPHVAAWAKYSDTDTTLWFWSSELAWATVHRLLDENGWQYEEACIWDKGIAHVAGNCNSKTIRGVPVVTEIAVRYSKRNKLPSAEGQSLALKEWVRAEWLRSGLPMRFANEACGVINAATRKYLTQCHMWYFPPPDAMQGMADYCASHGKRTNHPYFSLDGKSPFDCAKWGRMRSKWRHTHGVTNVWNEPPVHGDERVKLGSGYMHANQKPLRLMEFQVSSCTDVGDTVWEPFGGLCSASIAATGLKRRAFASEIFKDYFDAAALRINKVSGSKSRMAA
jgi:DNA methylase